MYVDPTNSAGGIKVTDRTKPAVVVTASMELEFRHECPGSAEVFVADLKELVNEQLHALVVKQLLDPASDTINADPTPAHQVYINVKHE